MKKAVKSEDFRNYTKYLRKSGGVIYLGERKEVLVQRRLEIKICSLLLKLRRVFYILNIHHHAYI